MTRRTLSDSNRNGVRNPDGDAGAAVAAGSAGVAPGDRVAYLLPNVPEMVVAHFGVPLAGADGYEARSNQRVLLARRSGLHVARIDHLLGRYGGMIDEVLDLVAQRAELGLPLEGADDYLAAEIVYAVTHEGARHLDDVLTRRTRVSIETFDRGVAAAPGIARRISLTTGRLCTTSPSDEVLTSRIDFIVIRGGSPRDATRKYLFRIE